MSVVTNKSNVSPGLTNLKQMMAQFSQIVFLYNLSANNLEFINPAFNEVWETKRKNIDEKWLLDSVHPEDRVFVEENFRKFLAGTESQKFEFRIQLPRGQIKWIALLVYFYFEKEQKKALLGLAEDISIRKEREDNTAKFTARKNAVLDILSHDIKGSLAMIQVMNDQIAEQVKKMDKPDLVEYSRIIGQLCANNIRMVHALLESELIESAELEPVRKRLDLIKSVKHVFNEYQRSARQLNRKFTFECDSKAIYLKVDESLISQIFNNLIANAVKFTPEGGEVSVCLKEHVDYVQACVQDNGIGVPAKLQSALFDRFTKARRPGLRGEETTGLGLSIVKKIVELHGGKIWVESEENKGAAFYFTIPKVT